MRVNVLQRPDWPGIRTRGFPWRAATGPMDRRQASNRPPVAGASMFLEDRVDPVYGLLPPPLPNVPRLDRLPRNAL